MSESVAPGQTPVEKHGMFVRNATGLVREVSPLSAATFNIYAGAPGLTLAVSVFWVLAAYPGAHIISAYWLTGLIALVVALPFAFLSTAMPRSGGDYVLVSRSLAPPFGIASSLGLWIGVSLVNGFNAISGIKLAVIPGLATIGYVSGHESWVNFADTISSDGWVFFLSAVMILIAIGLAALRLRLAMRIQIVCFTLGILGILIATITMFVVGTGTFASRFDALGGAGAYQHVLQSATVVGSGASWTNTLPAIGALASVLPFTWWSVAYAGEIRSARTWRNAGTMTISLLAFVLLLTIATLAMYSMVGDHFLAASNELSGTADYPKEVAPYWWAFTAVASKSMTLTIFLVVTMFLWFQILLWVNLAPIMRGLFAWSFDGLLPQRVASVSRRSAVPYVSLAIVTVINLACLAWANLADSFFTLLAAGIFLLTMPMILAGAGAALLPFINREIWKRSPLPITVGGVPLLTIIGVLGLLGGAFIASILLAFPGLGIASRTNALLAMLGCFIGGFVVYWIARTVRRSQGVDIALNYREIPPE